MKYKFGMFKPHTYKKLKIILGFAPLPKYYKKNELTQKKTFLGCQTTFVENGSY